MAGIGKEYPELSWYYLYLSNKELKRYISVFSGRKTVRLHTPSGTVEERFFASRCFLTLPPIIGKRFGAMCLYQRGIYRSP